MKAMVLKGINGDDYPRKFMNDQLCLAYVRPCLQDEPPQVGTVFRLRFFFLSI